MKEIAYIFFSFFLLPNLFGQTAKKIEIREIFITDSSQIKSVSDFKKKSSAFFEDEKYTVRSTCRGEFGGTVWFKNKKTGVEYSCSATCPSVVNKIGTKYFVTTNLLHMRGFTGVIEIDNPESMEIFKLPKPNTTRGPKPKIYSDQYESQSLKGTKSLVDSMGILTLASFVYESSLYHIVTHTYHDKLYISTIENNKFKTIDTIPKGNGMLITRSVLTEDGHYIMFFKGDCTQGYMDIFGSKIDIIRYDHLLGLSENCH